MKALIAIVMAAALSLTGCMSNPQTDQAKINVNTALVEYKAGRMKGSDYYTLMYNEISKTNASDKAFIMQMASTMIDASFAYESGKITKREFESRRRQIHTEVTAVAQQQNAALAQAQAAHWRRVASNIANAKPTPYGGGLSAIANGLNNRQTVNCYSQRVGMVNQMTCN